MSNGAYNFNRSYSSTGGATWNHNGFGGSSGGFGQTSFGVPSNGYENGFQSGFSGGFSNGAHSQGYAYDANGYPNNNMSNDRPSNGGFSYRADNTYKQNGSDWTKQSAGCDNQEKDLFDSINSGINFDKYDDIPVQVTGGNPPTPIESFNSAKLHQFVQENVQKSGYQKPTPVQKHSIPTLIENRDLMSCAQTGSGKTAAFLLPIIHHILTDGPEAVKSPIMSSSGRRCFFPSALILSPTRELAIQIHKEASKFSYRTNLISAILYGGRENYREQINKLRVGCNILIATPGRLIDIIEQGYIGLAGCKYLVLDEADRMLDMGFEPQIRKIVQSGQMPDRMHRITAMFSATFPKAIQELAQDFLKPNYLFLAVGRVGSTSDNIDQEVLFVEEHDKKRILMEILAAEDPNSLVLIFVETKRGANELCYFLQRQQIRAVAIHGDLKQYERERNLQVFRNGEYPVLVATAVAARGLDIPNVKHVINNDLPSDIDEYVHRIGRTGRCGNTGKATSFFNDKNRSIAKELMQLMSEAHKDVPDWLQRAATGSRPSGSTRGGGGNRGRFGGTDVRRGGSTFNRGGFSSGGSYFGTPNSGYGGYSSSFGGGYTNNYNAGCSGYGSSGGFDRPSYSGGFGGSSQGSFNQGGWGNKFVRGGSNGFGTPLFSITQWNQPPQNGFQHGEVYSQSGHSK